MGVRREARLAAERNAPFKYEPGDHVCVIPMKQSGTVLEQKFYFPGQKAYRVQLDDGEIVDVVERQVGPDSMCTDEQLNFGFMKEQDEAHDYSSWSAFAIALVLIGITAIAAAKLRLQPNLA